MFLHKIDNVLQNFHWLNLFLLNVLYLLKIFAIPPNRKAKRKCRFIKIVTFERSVIFL